MSVRDSVWRASEFGPALTQTLAGTPSPRVLVLGLGPSGMSLTVSLLQSGASVVACQMVPTMLDDAIGQCQLRYLCPTTFDFPARDWPTRQFSLSGGSTALNWSFGRAAAVYSRFETRFVKAVKRFELEGTYAEASPGRLSKVRVQPDHVEAVVEGIGTGMPERFDAIVVCGGPGQQSLTVPNVTGGCFAAYGFWNNRDPLIVDPATGSGQRVLILGGQDGGIGDFVRLLTGKEDPFDVLTRLSLPKRYLSELHDLNKRMWDEFENGTPDSDHASLVGLQADLIRWMDNRWETDEDLKLTVTKLLLDPAQRPFVQLLVGCDHFGLAYFANRIAAQLLARALALKGVDANGGLRPFRVGCHCEAVRGLDGHVCKADPDDCAGFAHEVFFSPWTCRRDITDTDYLAGCCNVDPIRPWKATVDLSTEPAVYDRVIARFGAIAIFEHLPGDLVAALQAAKRTSIRQVPPFYRV